MVDGRDVGVWRGEVRLERRELGRAVLVEQVGIERAGEDAVVDPEDDVALWVAGRQQRLVQRLVRVAALQDAEGESRLPLERLLDGLGHRERVVGHEHDVLRLTIAAAAACRQGGRHDSDGAEAEPAEGSHRDAPVGTDREEDALGDPDVGVRRREDVRHAARRARRERLGGERILESRGGDACRRAAERHERDDLARGPREPSLAAHDVDERLADEGVELETRESIRSELEERGEQMVETAARARDDEHAPGAERDRLVQGELEVGRVLRDRMPHDPRAGPLRRGDGRLGRRVEIADHDVDVEPERECALEAAVRRDDRRVAGHGDRRARSRCDDHDIRLDHAFLRWHYPGQVLRVGGALATLSARLPELPDSLPRMLDDCRATARGTPSRRAARARVTSIAATCACGGPTANQATSSATARSDPSSSASTVPAAVFRTQPATPSSWARSLELSRNQTPCTRPRTTTPAGRRPSRAASRQASTAGSRSPACAGSASTWPRAS